MESIAIYPVDILSLWVFKELLTEPFPGAPNDIVLDETDTQANNAF